jgi:uncharacterized MAPEG superfamily protein
VTTELTYLAWALVLAIGQIMLAAVVRTQQYGLKWNAGPRDADVPPPKPLAGRLQRAQQNLFETLPLFAAAVLIAVAAQKDGSALTIWGSRLYVWGRVVYVPLYALGVPFIRSLVWLVSLAGLLLVIAALFIPTA